MKTKLVGTVLIEMTKYLLLLVSIYANLQFSPIRKKKKDKKMELRRNIRGNGGQEVR
jgi:hypothetical protein